MNMHIEPVSGDRQDTETGSTPYGVEPLSIWLAVLCTRGYAGPGVYEEAADARVLVESLPAAEGNINR
jgi:hypothetical protein